MENPKDKAKEMVTKFAIYDWDEISGYQQNMEETVKYCQLIVDEILQTSASEYEHENNFWVSVKRELSIHE